jgi:endogenous inhibitor of DNA gyrase (YacG/DUF329 family)
LGTCPTCQKQVAADLKAEVINEQIQQQSATVSCACGHTVTLKQWQRQN